MRRPKRLPLAESSTVGWIGSKLKEKWRDLMPHPHPMRYNRLPKSLFNSLYCVSTSLPTEGFVMILTIQNSMWYFTRLLALFFAFSLLTGLRHRRKNEFAG